jgi:hypothetical protein
MKDWEIIADDLSKAGGVGAAPQPSIPRVERSGLRTRIAATESALLCMPMKSSARLWNWNLRFALAANCLDRLARFFQTRRR